MQETSRSGINRNAIATIAIYAAVIQKVDSKDLHTGIANNQRRKKN